MKLIDDIKKAEEKAEKIKKEAEIEGQKLLEKERDSAARAFAELDEYQNKLAAEKLAQAGEKADKDIKVLDQTHHAEIKKMEKSFKENKNNAIKSVQEIILKWPSSQ
jgi:V/A-type H+-transporting ATPase subunit G/H